MPNKKDPIKYDLLTDSMRITDDGASVLVGNQKFKRTVLPSVATPKAAPSEDALLDELEDE